MSEVKACTRCGETKPIHHFKKVKSAPTGRGSWCKPCHSDSVCDHQKKNRERATANSNRYFSTEKGRKTSARYKRARRIVHRKARPSWFDRDAVDAIYDDAHARGLHVDHIVPLQSKLVCGFHVQNNLVAIDPVENKKKSNRYWPDGPHQLREGEY